MFCSPAQIFRSVLGNVGLSFAFVKCILFICTCTFWIVMEFQSLALDAETGCARSEPAGGIRRHHAGTIRHEGGAASGGQSARDEPCTDTIASHAERRTIRS